MVSRWWGRTPRGWLILCAPAGFEKFVLELCAPADAAPAPPDMARLAAIAARFNIDILGPLPDEPHGTLDAAAVADDNASLIGAVTEIRDRHVAAVTSEMPTPRRRPSHPTASFSRRASRRCRGSRRYRRGSRTSSPASDYRAQPSARDCRRARRHRHRARVLRRRVDARCVALGEPDHSPLSNNNMLRRKYFRLCFAEELRRWEPPKSSGSRENRSSSLPATFSGQRRCRNGR